MLLLVPCLRRVLRPARTLVCSLGSGRRSESCPFFPPAPSLLSCFNATTAAFTPRCLGTHSAKEPVEPLNTSQGARDFIYSLHSKERKSLLQELQRFESMAIAQACPGHRYPRAQTPISSKWREQAAAEEIEVKPPSSAQYRYVFLHSAIPFIGFGFLDNAIMIAAGTQIELSLGVIFGISTMAAAALGNLVSDVAGLGLAGYVEALASRLGLPSPDLNPKQADMWQTRLSSQLGKVIGVIIGCILGMFPLLFFKIEEEEKLEECKN
ncbi:transmembrane protein 65 isoform X1 [Stegostoma tigrinum]|uniref:transmembrane protein 65 isoform X1 n=1 Tax=Stegostoma tigrinum TaxID=3053191 RepID=UPI00202B87E7|nr:transmembrane protein 65 isoform X1 [Stegostoma tigrinum]